MAIVSPYFVKLTQPGGQEIAVNPLLVRLVTKLADGTAQITLSDTQSFAVTENYDTVINKLNGLI
jgi:uncharacterized protein YlzI (FlbEa/FlbD family)